MAFYLEVTKLRRWPYNKLTKADQHVVARFFDSEPFFAHGWDIYHYETSSNNFYLIHFNQILKFFAQITAETGLAAFKNVSPSKIAFRIDPDSGGEPCFAGTIGSKEDFDRLKGLTLFDNGDFGSGTGSQDKIDRKLRQREKSKKNFDGWRAQVKSAISYLGFDKDAAEDNIKPVFVSVDVESHEYNHNAITEVGISILDTARLPPRDTQYTINTDDDKNHPNYLPPKNNIPTIPSSRAEEILGLVESHHFRISENRHLRNGNFVNDNADNFNFGASEYISLKEAPAVIANCFRYKDEHENRRRIVLVGHDTKTDIDYLRKLGYKVTNIADLEIMDTVSMWKAVKWENQGRGLSSVLMELGLEAWNLHNAGNDAAYTLQAVIKIAEKGLTDIQPEEPDSQTTPTHKTRTIVRAEDIQIGIEDNDEEASTRPIGWKVAKEGKGKAALKPAPPPVRIPVYHNNSESEASPLSVDGDGW